LEPVEWFGFAAGGIMTICTLPQVLRVFKLKSAREISLIFVTAMTIGFICWLLYGIFLGLFPIILWNSFNIVLFSVFLFAKLKYGR
jgi:MtN3 and saliva related transmembrane protein